MLSPHSTFSELIYDYKRRTDPDTPIIIVRSSDENNFVRSNGSGKSAKSRERSGLSRERTKSEDYTPVKRRVFPVEDLVYSSDILHEIHSAAKKDKSNSALTLI